MTAGTKVSVDIRYAARRPWVPGPAQFSRWARIALQPVQQPTALSVFVVGAARSRALNARYRGRHRPASVLAFAGAGQGPDGLRELGELVICAPVVEREARAQGKSREFHWAHMTVHGVLHLRGFDHKHPAEARKMAKLEIQLLEKLGFSDPYA
jgi:probable rRNA maturation factor